MNLKTEMSHLENKTYSGVWCCSPLTYSGAKWKHRFYNSLKGQGQRSASLRLFFPSLSPLCFTSPTLESPP